VPSVHRRSLGSDGADRLGGLELFADTTVGERRMLARLVDEIVCEPGETIMQEGASEYEFIVLEQGSAEVTRQGRPINQLAAGAFFGELAVLEDGAPRSASVTATSPVRGLVLTAHFMRETRERFPAIGERIDAAAKEHLQADAGRGETPG
jgi:CRP/FNR family transcriptional regulator, cyclic AMP receptor protein